MDSIELYKRIEDLEAQVRAISEHLKIVIIQKPKRFEVMTEKELEKSAQIPITRG